ncbi:hypothetical protein [Nonomuraea dietziae]|uniref:hypothetical protein n=1 Tax=Nonomuraea dietziae TaxID=65515 RepID=UPI0031CEB302
MAMQLSPEVRDQHWERRLAEAVPAVVRDRLVVFREGYGEKVARRVWVAARKDAYLGPPHLAQGRKAPSARGGMLGYRLLHLVGQVVDTAAGPRLRTADDGATAVTRRVRAGERLIGPELEDAIGLVVLQPEPDERPRGLGESRAAFLSVATRAFARNAQAVLVLPTLTDALAAEVTSAIRAGYPSGLRQPYPTEMLELALKVKRILGPGLADEMVLLLKTPLTRYDLRGHPRRPRRPDDPYHCHEDRREPGRGAASRERLSGRRAGQGGARALRVRRRHTRDERQDGQGDRQDRAQDERTAAAPAGT